MVFIYISLIISDDEHLFLYLVSHLKVFLKLVCRSFLLLFDWVICLVYFLSFFFFGIEFYGMLIFLKALVLQMSFCQLADSFQ